MDVETGRSRNLTADFDRAVDEVYWAGSSNRLLIRYEDFGRTYIGRLSLDGKVEALVDDVGGTSIGRPYNSGSFSVADNGVYAYTAVTPDRPADVAVARGGRSPLRLTALNEDLLGARTLGRVEEITWRSTADDLEIRGWLVYPPGFDAQQQYPLILEIHGGPHTAYGPHFSAEAQLFAAAGYVVLYANPRGSTSYGDAFALEIHHDYPGRDYDDLMAGIDAVIERGFVDEDALYVTGGSGGGVLTAWIVGKTDRFSAAVVAKPVVNWTSFTLTADIMHFVARHWFPAMPWEDPDAYWSRSPLSLVGNVTTPTALLTGEEDFRTPMAESEQYYQALKLRKVDTALIRIPEASHGIAARPSQLIAKVDNILAWFARYPAAGTEP
jgi:acylaminoacyl-peptidase